MGQVHWSHAWMSWLCQIVKRVSKHLFLISVLISLWIKNNQFSDRLWSSMSSIALGDLFFLLSQSHCCSVTPLEWRLRSDVLKVNKFPISLFIKTNKINPFFFLYVKVTVSIDIDKQDLRLLSNWVFQLKL